MLVADYSPFISRLNLLKGGRSGNCPSIQSSISGRQKNELFISGQYGESCTNACKRNKQRCDDQLIGLLLNCGNTGICGHTKKEWSTVINCNINDIQIQYTGQIKRAAPGKHKNGQCISTIGRHLSCDGKHEEMKRACICTSGTN